MTQEPDATPPGPAPEREDQATAWLSQDQVRTVALARGEVGPGAEPPPEVPGYAIQRVLGRGGMGVVYLAQDLKLGRPVALKRVIFHDPELSRRLVQEARSQARIDHPHVCKVFEAGEAGGVPYVAMQFIEGRPLDEAAGQLPIEARVRLLAEVAEAVHAAHRQGLIHRDLKPANILVAAGEGGEPWPFVMDFGLAQDQTSSRLTQVGAVMGTPAYMAPEQARGDVHILDRRTDVYALGATLYEVLTGHPPFEGRSGADTLLRVIQEEPAPLRKLAPGLPEDLEVIALKCLEKEPARRYDSAKALAEDLRAWLDGDPIRARRTSLLERAAKKIRKHKPLVAFAAVAAAGVLVGTVSLLRSRGQIQQASELSRQFGAEFAEAEAILRYGHLMAVHPVLKEEEKVLELRKRLEQRLKGLRGLPLAAGRMALGRVLLLQGRNEPAKQELEAARQAGLKDPQLNLALSQAYLEVWSDRELESVVSLTGEDLLQAQEKHRTTLLDPAEALLAGQEAPLMHYRLALARRQPSEAETWKRKALEEEPWAYEAHLAESQAIKTRALAALGAGRFAEARSGFEEAWKSLERARAVAPSDPALAKSGYKLASLANDANYRQALPPDPRWTSRSEASLDLLDRLRPRAPEARFLRAKWQTEQLLAKNDRTPVSEEEWEAPRAALSELALGASPFQVEAAFMVATVRILEIQGRAARHADTTPLLDAMIPELEKVLRSVPEHPDLLNRLGLAYRYKASQELETGRDGTPTLAKAAEIYRRILKRYPEHLEAQMNLQETLVLQVTSDRSRGLDPTHGLQEASRLATQIRQRVGEEVDVLKGLTAILAAQASWALERGQDPSGLLAEADQCLEPLLKNPIPLVRDQGTALSNRIGLLRLQGRWEHGDEAGEASTKLFRRMESLVSRPGQDAARYDLADGLVLRARSLREHGAQPEATLQKAEALLAPLKEDPEAMTLRLRIALLRSEAGDAAARAASRKVARQGCEALAGRRFGNTFPVKARARLAWLDLREGRGGSDGLRALSEASKADPFDAESCLMEADAARRLLRKTPGDSAMASALADALHRAQAIRPASLDLEWLSALASGDTARAASLKAKHPWLARRWPEA